MPVGAAWLPRLKSQRSRGSERDAGWERRRGMSKVERVAMPPEVKSAVERVRIWMTFDIAGRQLFTRWTSCCWISLTGVF